MRTDSQLPGSLSPVHEMMPPLAHRVQPDGTDPPGRSARGTCTAGGTADSAIAAMYQSSSPSGIVAVDVFTERYPRNVVQRVRHRLRTRLVWVGPCNQGRAGGPRVRWTNVRAVPCQAGRSPNEPAVGVDRGSDGPHAPASTVPEVAGRRPRQGSAMETLPSMRDAFGGAGLGVRRAGRVDEFGLPRERCDRPDSARRVRKDARIVRGQRRPWDAGVLGRPSRTARASVPAFRGTDITGARHPRRSRAKSAFRPLQAPTTRRTEEKGHGSSGSRRRALNTRFLHRRQVLRDRCDQTHGVPPQPKGQKKSAARRREQQPHIWS